MNTPLSSLARVILAVVGTLLAIGFCLGAALFTGSISLNNPFAVAPSNYIEKQLPNVEVNPSKTPAVQGEEDDDLHKEDIDVCGDKAVQLGFWAVDDKPETFTIDSRGKVTHLQLWLPGVTPEDVEISVILSDAKYKIVDGGGTAWQWDCLDESAARADAIASGLRRAEENKTTYQMTIDQVNAEYTGTIIVLDP